MPHRMIWVLVPAVVAVACGVQGGPAPEEVVVQFVDLMDRARSDPRALREAYELLDTDAQAELAARAELTRTLSGGGKGPEPWEMLVAERFAHRLSLGERGATTTTIGDDRALVVVRSSGGRHGEVPLVRQEGRWRLVLALPGAPGAATAAPRSAAD